MPPRKRKPRVTPHAPVQFFRVDDLVVQPGDLFHLSHGYSPSATDKIIILRARIRIDIRELVAEFRREKGWGRFVTGPTIPPRREYRGPCCDDFIEWLIDRGNVETVEPPGVWLGFRNLCTEFYGVEIPPSDLDHTLIDPGEEEDDPEKK